MQGISVASASTMDEAFNCAIKMANKGDTVLLSPSGSSYDLFKDFEARGNYFRKLVDEYAKTVDS